MALPGLFVSSERPRADNCYLGIPQCRCCASPLRSESLILYMDSPLETPGFRASPTTAVWVSMNEFVTQKNYIRTRIKHERQNLTSPFMQRSAIALLGHVSQSQLIENHNNIAFYLPVRGEISCMPIIEYALSQGKKCFVPKIRAGRKRSMWFLPYEGRESVEKGQFGILEPTASASRAIATSELELVFMPLVAFDNTGNRLGMGGGYYDTVFGSLSPQKRPQRIGLAYNLQKVPQVPAEKWDLKMDGVITPNHYHRFTE